MMGRILRLRLRGGYFREACYFWRGLLSEFKNFDSDVAIFT